MKFKKGKLYYDARFNEILKYSRKRKGCFIFLEQEEKNGSFKVWGNSVIAMRVYSEKTAQRLIDYENLKLER